MSNQKTVFVGLSGGVDSSVAALRLKNLGYKVVGVFIKVWHPDWLTCNWEQERLDAMRVAARLKIPFLTCDAATTYKDDVADYFIKAYAAGHTPNPDVRCNKYVKFGRFLEFADEHGADYVATGHYAQIKNSSTNSNSTLELHRGVDHNKDQTYFLWTLTQNQLSRTLFPVGDTPKNTIRTEAAAANLATAEKADSQGVCFLGHIDIKEFLSHYIDLVPGTVLDESGNEIGTHDGALIYTIGQRHGFTVSTTTTSETPHFVTKKDVTANTITVSPDKPITADNTKITLTETNIIGEIPQLLDQIQVQTRYRQTPISAHVTHVEEAELTLELNKPSDAVSAGQSCVLYDGPVCLGGGIIS